MSAFAALSEENQSLFEHHEMSKLRAAVVGVGYLGKYHAEKYQQIPEAELVAVCDVNAAVCSEIGQKLNVRAITDYRALIGLVDIVSIVVPTEFHYKIGEFFLEHGVHVLLEKPIATSVEQAEALTQLAAKKHRVLQIGHIEQFNSAFVSARPFIKTPQLIEIRRISPFKPRCLDVDVVLDLMIHDIDLVYSIVNSALRHIAASGMKVISPTLDVASVRLEFVNGCVANLVASRISAMTSRTWQVFQREGEVAIDLNEKQINVQQKNTGAMVMEKQSFAGEKSDALKDEIAAFINCVINGKAPLVDGKSAARALQTALTITEIIAGKSS